MGSLCLGGFDHLQWLSVFGVIQPPLDVRYIVYMQNTSDLKRLFLDVLTLVICFCSSSLSVAKQREARMELVHRSRWYLSIR